MTVLVSRIVGTIGLVALAVILGNAARGDSAAPARGASLSLATAPVFEHADRVERLIDALGSEHYIARREAENELLEIGMAAFDQIDAAINHPDPEISASCRYLVSELTVRWIRRNDPPQVKAALNNYANEDESRRFAVVEALGARADRWAIAPLCRICRYDASSVVARQAAIELLRSGEYPLGYTAEDAEVLRREIGTSVRPQAEWVRLLAAQINSPDTARAAWWPVVDQATSAAAASLDDTQLGVQCVELLRNMVRIELDRQNGEALLQAVERLLEQPNVSAISELAKLFESVNELDAPQLVDGLLASYGDLLSNSKSGLYLLARVRVGQGELDLANQLAEQALQAVTIGSLAEATESRIGEAERLLAEGHVEWARRELRAAIAEAPPISNTHAKAAMVLAMSLHDWQLDAEAAKVLAVFTAPLRADSDLSKQYDRRVQQNNRTSGRRLYSLDEVEAYQHYYDACRFNAEEDTEAEWRALERAYKLDDSNADIIIAMYRASDAHPVRRAAVRQVIQTKCRELEQRIDDPTLRPDYGSGLHNEWAWLVSNTEGDFWKAVRYSHKSLDLFAEHMAADRRIRLEDSASYLDTLGRCYFAAGDYQAAVKHQSEAVEYQPQLRVLRRQLDEFREALSTSSDG